MEIGQRQRGTDFPVCQFAEGCRDPFPELEGLDQVAFQLFVLCRSQFDVAVGMGGAVKVKLDYKALEYVARIHGVDVTPALFRKIQTMEAAALEASDTQEPDGVPRDSDGWIEAVN